MRPVTLCIFSKKKSRVENKKSCRKKSRAEKKKLCRKKVVLKKRSRANKTVVPKKRVVPEKTNIVKKKLDDKNYVALTGLRNKCPLGKFKTKMTTHYVSAWFRRFYGKIGHC